MIKEIVSFENGTVTLYTSENKFGCKVIIGNKGENEKFLNLFSKREEQVALIDIEELKNLKTIEIISFINDIYDYLYAFNLYVDIYSSLDAACYILGFMKNRKKAFRKTILYMPNLNAIEEKVYSPLYNKLQDAHVICISDNAAVLDYCVYNNLVFLKTKKLNNILNKIVLLFDAYDV